MATAKKGLIQRAVGAVTDAFMDPPLAPNLGLKPMRRVAKKSPVAKVPAKKTSAKRMDSKLVSGMEDYEVKYLAQKHSVTQKAVKAAVAKVGHSRNKVESELKKSKLL